ncbi:S1C family serine protease [Rhodopirellula sp. JC737]|nr:S1C family serine protease [Rhodopirellula sp. JC737]
MNSKPNATNRRKFSPVRSPFIMVFLLIALQCHVTAHAQPSMARPSDQVQPKMVKIYGAGGLSGLEAYQSGFLVSPAGHIATAWSYVLDVDPVVILHDGRRFESTIVGFEPSLELAVLKVEADGLPFFTFSDQEDLNWGDPVLAVSNLFGIATGNETASVMQGRVAARTNLDARRGTFQTPYRGEVLLLDLVANNPGAAGGALVDPNGAILGMLGKELRDRKTGVWLNYAIPASVLKKPIGDIIAGRKTTLPDESDPLLAREKSHSPDSLGIGLIPDVLENTPAYIDFIQTGSSASKVDLRPDDLIVLINGRRVAHQRALRDQLRRIDRRDSVTLIVQRGNEILERVVRP